MIELYCDGSCPKPNGPGGWAFIIVHANGLETVRSGCAPSTTNNRMELMGAIKGLRYLRRQTGQRIRVTSDSQYVIKGISEYVHAWVKRGWKRRVDGLLVPVKNQDLWEEFFELSYRSGLQMEFEWVRGHNGHEYNERCDELAGAETRKMKEFIEEANYRRLSRTLAKERMRRSFAGT